jgi:hypothetical protein
MSQFPERAEVYFAVPKHYVIGDEYATFAAASAAARSSIQTFEYESGVRYSRAFVDLRMRDRSGDKPLQRWEVGFGGYVALIPKGKGGLDDDERAKLNAKSEKGGSMKPTRYAKVKGPDHAIRAYLPENYKVVAVHEDHVLIAGQDNAGWTLDGYVLPRLASGLYFGEEVEKVTI